MIISVFSFIPSNGVKVEWNWQGKAEVLGGKPVSVPLCPPQIPHGRTRNRNRASEVRGQRLTAWAMARPLRKVTYMSVHKGVISQKTDILMQYVVRNMWHHITRIVTQMCVWSAMRHFSSKCPVIHLFLMAERYPAGAVRHLVCRREVNKRFPLTSVSDDGCYAQLDAKLWASAFNVDVSSKRLY
jgi:hypothetical protein